MSLIERGRIIDLWYETDNAPFNPSNTLHDLNVEAYRFMQQCKQCNYQEKFHLEEGVVEEVKIFQILPIKDSSLRDRFIPI